MEREEDIRAKVVAARASVQQTFDLIDWGLSRLEGMGLMRSDEELRDALASARVSCAKVRELVDARLASVEGDAPSEGGG